MTDDVYIQTYTYNETNTTNTIYLHNSDGMFGYDSKHLFVLPHKYSLYS